MNFQDWFMMLVEGLRKIYCDAKDLAAGPEMCFDDPELISDDSKILVDFLKMVADDSKMFVDDLKIA